MAILGPAYRAARAACRLGSRMLPSGPPGVTVLAYHLVGGGTSSPVDLPPAVFRRQMEELRQRGAEVVPLSRVVTILEESEPLEHDLVALTFDDAFRNFDEQAFPVLEGLGLPATVFVPTGFVDGSHPGPLAGAERLPAVPWPRLRELAESGLVELGSHSRTHPDLRALGDDGLASEVAGSKAVLRDRIGRDPLVFCYPRALRTNRVEAAVAGSYRGAVVGGGRKNVPGVASPLRIHRVSLRNDMPASLAPVLGASVVLEERAADLLRSLRRPGSDGA